MARTWILYNKEDRQVEWPACIKNLSPANKKYPLESCSSRSFSEFSDDYDEVDRIFSAIHSLKVLGTCKTSQYLLCPNIPEHHRENASCGPRRYAESREEYFQRFRGEQERYFGWIGGYSWIDFDIDLNGKTAQLRMVLNWGDADCNDGFWGEVWRRNTGKKIADILSTGDMETTIRAEPELERIIDFAIYVLQCT